VLKLIQTGMLIQRLYMKMQNIYYIYLPQKYIYTHTYNYFNQNQNNFDQYYIALA